MKKIAFILGTRPEVVKLYPLIADCVSRAQDFFILHTNQHYDENMDAVFFRDLGIPLPKYNLGVGSGSHGAQIGKMLVGIEEVLQKEMPDVVVVQGDTNTVLAGALVASRCNIKVAHVEAGLRSYDRTMPEEVNRILTDSISDFLFCPTEKQKEILLAENIPDNKIFVTGNTIVDAINRSIKIAESKSTILNELGIEKDKYFLLTCHRPDNTDNKDNFEKNNTRS
jgi:UDP-N-acetylglucosamine 2-epimerase (non-hydrolysing)